MDLNEDQKRRNELGFRRATDAEIAQAQAWVDFWTEDWVDADDLEQARQTEYEHALEILVFANGGRAGARPSMTAAIREEVAQDILADPGPQPRLGSGQWWEGYGAAKERAAGIARGEAIMPHPAEEG